MEGIKKMDHNITWATMRCVTQKCLGVPLCRNGRRWIKREEVEFCALEGPGTTNHIRIQSRNNCTTKGGSKLTCGAAMPMYAFWITKGLNEPKMCCYITVAANRQCFSLPSSNGQTIMISKCNPKITVLHLSFKQLKVENKKNPIVRPKYSLPLAQ